METKFISPFGKLNTVLVKVIERQFHPLYSFLESKDRSEFCMLQSNLFYCAWFDTYLLMAFSFFSFGKCFCYV
jgi:hypothetical protein